MWKIRSIIAMAILAVAVSCKAVQVKSDPISAFLTMTAADTEKFTLIREKIQTRHTIEIFKGTLPFERDRWQHMDTGVSGALFDNGAFEEMMSRYYDDNIHTSGLWSESQWAASDFSVPVAGFVSQELFDGITEETLNFRGDVYAFSDVISYAGRYAVFCYTRNFDYPYLFPLTVVVMEKTNGIWKIVEQANREF